MENLLSISKTNDWLIENLPFKIMWMEESGNIVYANSLFLSRLGYKNRDIAPLTVYDINPGVNEEIWALHWQEVKSKKRHSFKSVHQTKAGKYYDVEIYAQFFSNNGKELILAVVNDISESSFYRNLLNHAERMTNVGGWKLNLQDGSLIVTEQAKRIFNSENKEDFLPGNIIHFFQEPDEYKSLLSKAIRNGAPFDVVLTCGDKTGAVKHIRCVCEPIVKRKKIYKLVGAYQDVTEQRVKENRLQLFREIINNTEDLVYVYNRSGKLIQYNDSVFKELGFSAKELDGFSIFDLDEKITEEWWNAHFDEIIQQGAVHLDWEVTRKNGTHFPANIVANHLVYDGEDLNCAIVRNITSLKTNENRLKMALDELSELKKDLEIDNQYLREEISQNMNLDNIICQSDAYQEVLDQVSQVAITDATVLITGESGTGKELLAGAVHENSKRKDRALIKVNCATLPKELIESELFGHRKGAFTGATENKLGKFSMADGGTIFLDEIGEVPIELQAKLLRVLQEGEFDELGANKTTKVDVRIIAATNRNLEEMVNEGTFREDLYYRLNVFPIHNIPLRARKEDIPLLAEFFLEKYAAKAGKHFTRLSKKTIDRFMAYDFPGNIRELENLVERAVIIEKGPTLNPGSWLPKTSNLSHTEDFMSFEQMQRDYIVKILNHTNWRVSGPKGAATILNLKDKTLFAKMKRLGIEKKITLKS
jgi:PAS domain S-box-containing protein